jgi:hypothetical protein
MNVVDHYTDCRELDDKLSYLLGPFKKKFDRSEAAREKISPEELEERTRRARRIDTWKRSAELVPRSEKRYLNFASPLQPLVKRRVAVEPADTAANEDRILKDFKPSADVFLDSENEPVLDCFIRLKKEGHLARSPPRQATVAVRFDRELRGYPEHRTAGYGFRRNGFGKPLYY